MIQQPSHTANNITAAPTGVRGPVGPFDVRAFLDPAGISRRMVHYARSSVVFAQGGPANSVFYIHEGGVRAG